MESVTLVEMKLRSLRENLLNMYQKYAEAQGWRVEVMNANVTVSVDIKKLFK